MTERLVSGVLREELPDGVRYRLPRRTRGGFGAGGRPVALLALGALVLLLALEIGVLAALRGPGTRLLAFLLFTVAQAIVVLTLREAARLSRTVLEFRGGRVAIEERLGFLRGRRMSPEGRAPAEIEVRLRSGGDAELVFHLPGFATLPAARGYPEEFLRRFRGELAERHLSPRVTRPPLPAPSSPARPASRPAAAPAAPRPEGGGITFLPDPASPVAAPAGECQVCGTALSGGALVACERCGTLHHRACWDYVKRCSTYACGGTRAVPLGPRSAPPAEVVEIRESRGRLRKKQLREWMRAVAEEHGWRRIRSRDRKGRRYEVTFQVGRMVCTLKGRKSGDRFEFAVHAVLPTAAHVASAAGVSLPPRYSWIDRQVEPDEATLRPRTAIDGLPLLRGFVRGCREYLEAVSAGA